jgi:hypothetical protein
MTTTFNTQQLTLFFGFLSARPRADGGLLLVPVTVTHELPCTTVATAPPAAVLTIPPLTLLPPPLAEPSLPPPLPQRIVVHGDDGLGALGGGKMYSISTQHVLLTIHTPMQSTRPLAPLRITSHIIYYKPSTWNRPNKPPTWAELIRFVGVRRHPPTTSSQLQMHSLTKNSRSTVAATEETATAALPMARTVKLVHRYIVHDPPRLMASGCKRKHLSTYTDKLFWWIYQRYWHFQIFRSKLCNTNPRICRKISSKQHSSWRLIYSLERLFLELHNNNNNGK